MKTECGISIRSAGRYKFIPAWRTPKDVLKFIKLQLQGKVLCLCCGESLLGDVNVDMFVGGGTDVYGRKVINADVLDKDFDLKERFDTVVADPPYNWPYDKRAAFNRTVQKHLKKGGRFVLNAPWIPRAFDFRISEVWIVHSDSGLPANVTLVTIAIKKT